VDNTPCAGLHDGLAVYPSKTWADQVGLNAVRRDVVYTAKDIAKGQTITEEDLEFHEVQASEIPANAVSSMKSLVGTKAPREIPARQVVTLGP
jgi:flagella basal body P-ring formation protein FlgA